VGLHPTQIGLLRDKHIKHVTHQRLKTGGN